MSDSAEDDNNYLTCQHGVELLVIVLSVTEKPLDVIVAQLELLLLHGNILIRPDDDDDDEDEDLLLHLHCNISIHPHYYFDEDVELELKVDKEFSTYPHTDPIVCRKLLQPRPGFWKVNPFNTHFFQLSSLALANRDWQPTHTHASLTFLSTSISQFFLTRRNPKHEQLPSPVWVDCHCHVTAVTGFPPAACLVSLSYRGYLLAAGEAKYRSTDWPQPCIRRPHTHAD